MLRSRGAHVKVCQVCKAHSLQQAVCRIQAGVPCWQGSWHSTELCNTIQHQMHERGLQLQLLLGVIEPASRRAERILHHAQT
jgi:hypothetical protein